MSHSQPPTPTSVDPDMFGDGFFRSAIESSNDCVSVLDPEGRLLFINRSGLVALEIDDPSPLAGQACISFWPEPAASQIGRGLEAVRRHQTYRFEGACPTARGALKWWHVSMSPVLRANGELAGIIATSRDITEIRRASAEAEVRELSLATKAAALHSAAQIAHVGAWEIDFVAGTTTFSAELCALVGSPPLPPLPIHQANFWIKEDRAAFQRTLAQVEAVGERLAFEGRTTSPEGDLRWWRLFGEPVLVDGRCVGLRGAGQDVTEWRSALEREQSAVRAADTMSAFLATMSHELRTPLNGVLGMTEAMRRGELCVEQRERLEVIETSGASLLSLLNDLLDMSKIEADQVELEEGLVDTRVLADGARGVFVALAGEKDLTLTLRLTRSARGCWVGDPTRVRQILHNLISNAIKFTDVGSISVDISRRAGHLVLRVADTGIGIAAPKLGSVFERFVQADASMTRRYGGSGLGLTICRDLVSLMKGDIQVQSVEGEGATFVVRLPLARAPQLSLVEWAVGRGADPLPGSPGLRVLAAEDNAINQLVLKTMLSAVGVEPAVVSNGQEAVAAWGAGEFDVVLMDIQMPVMDGLSAVKLIRQAELIQGRSRTPIIAVTANGMAHHRAEYLTAGMDAMVAKPISMSDLLETIDAVLASKTAPAARLAI
jgi:PAS domain S-box-containing protein